MAEENNQITIDNTELVEAIQTLKSDQSPDNFNRVAKLIQAGRYLCPAELIENTEAVEQDDGRVSLENKRSFRFSTLSNSDGKRYMAVFTSYPEITKGNSPFSDQKCLVLDIVTLNSAFSKPENEAEIEGIVIDPFSNNFAVPKNILRSMAETELYTPKPNEQVKIYPPDRYPDGFLDAIREKLEADERVNQLFVLVLERQNKARNLLMIVDDEDKLSPEERKALYSEITKTVTPYTEGMHLMYVPYSDKLSQQATNNRLPCYRK